MLHQEQVQVLRYELTQKYDAHHDYFNPEFYQGDKNTTLSDDPCDPWDGHNKRFFALFFVQH